MRKFLFSKKTEAVFVTVAFCALGFFSIWIAKNSLGLKEEAIYIAFLILPILIYMIVSGRIIEFKAFGTEAKFAELAKQTIEPLLETIEVSVEDISMVAKGGINELQKLQNRISYLDESKPITLTLSLMQRNYYSIAALKSYVKTLFQYRTFKGVIILDENEWRY